MTRRTTATHSTSKCCPLVDPTRVAGWFASLMIFGATLLATVTRLMIYQASCNKQTRPPVWWRSGVASMRTAFPTTSWTQPPQPRLAAKVGGCELLVSASKPRTPVTAPLTGRSHPSI